MGEPENEPRRRLIRRSQSKRVSAGRRFEESLERTHAGYAAIGAAKIVPHYPRTIQTAKGLVRAKGGAPCDFSGVVTPPATPTSFTGSCAVAFDAKVLREEHASYVHDPDQRHQLLELLDFDRAGAFAFLLMQDRERNLVAAVYGLRLFQHMLARPKVPIVLRRGDQYLWPTAPFNLRGYDWRELLEPMLLAPDPDFLVLAPAKSTP